MIKPPDQGAVFILQFLKTTSISSCIYIYIQDCMKMGINQGGNKIKWNQLLSKLKFLRLGIEAKNNYDMNVHNTKFGLHLVLPGKSSFHEFLHWLHNKILFISNRCWFWACFKGKINKFWSSDLMTTKWCKTGNWGYWKYKVSSPLPEALVVCNGYGCV